MTVSTRDPAAMTESERLSEVAALLAKAYLRLVARRNPLEALPQAEALCALLNGPERPRKEPEWKKA